jgi:hypothetical protein
MPGSVSLDITGHRVAISRAQNVLGFTVGPWRASVEPVTASRPYHPRESRREQCIERIGSAHEF